MRAGLRCKIRTQISKPILQMVETALRIPDRLKTQDKIMTTLNFATPPLQSKGDSDTRMIDRKMIQDVVREIPTYQDQVYRPPPKPVKTYVPRIPGSLLDIDPELNADFEDNSPFQEGIISESYQRSDKSYFQEPQEIESLINTGRLIQKFLPKQADIDKLLKIIQRKVLKGMHLHVTVKEIQAGYLISSCFKDLYCAWLKTNCLQQRLEFEKVEMLAERYV